MEKGGWVYANTKMTKTIKKEYKASLKTVAGWAYATGKTALEAIENLKPPIAKGVGVLVLEHGKERREKILSGRDLNGLWGQVSRMNKEIAQKRIKMLFGL